MIVSVLFNGLWQGAILIAITWGIVALIPKRNASTRCALWLAALLALVVVPIATALSNAGAQLLQELSTPRTHATYTVALLPLGRYVGNASTWAERAVGWLVLLWVAGAAVNLLRLAVSFVRVEAIRRRARPFAAAGTPVYLSADVGVPIVAGILSPAIVLPQALPAQLSCADMERIIAHERAHVRRGDPLWNLLQRLIEAILFFNPWVRIASQSISNEREAACDDWVVAKTGNAGDYAACLAGLAQRLRTEKLPLLTAGVYRSRHALIARIERLDTAGPRRLTLNPYALGGIIVLFIVATLALQAISPALAVTPHGNALAGGGGTSVRIGAACAKPNADAQVTNAAAPSLPHGMKLSGSVEVAVTIAPNGRVAKTAVVRSSGSAAIDQAVVAAARRSTYSPKMVNCQAVEGQYLYRADFKPSP